MTSGNVRAFSTLYDRYREPVYRYCRSIVRDEADAHDAVQSTFMRALEALLRDGRDAPVRPWLFRIAHNEAISAIRRRRAGEALPAALRPHLVRAENRAEHREALESLLADLNELPERQRHAIVMRELSGLSHDEIALALGTTVSAARQAIFEARTALADFRLGRAMSCEEVRPAISEGDRRVLRGRRVRAHLRDCPACASFMASLGGGERLRAAAPPLAAVSAVRLAQTGARCVGTVTHHARALCDGLAGGVGDAAAASKALTGIALVSLAAGGTAALMPGRLAGIPAPPARSGVAAQAGVASGLGQGDMRAGFVHGKGATSVTNGKGRSKPPPPRGATLRLARVSPRPAGGSAVRSVGFEILVAHAVASGPALTRQTGGPTAPRSGRSPATAGGSGAGGAVRPEPAGGSPGSAGAGRQQPSGQTNGSGGGGDAHGGVGSEGGGGNSQGGGGDSQGGGGNSQGGGGDSQGGGGDSQGGGGDSQGGGASGQGGAGAPQGLPGAGRGGAPAAPAHPGAGNGHGSDGQGSGGRGSNGQGSGGQGSGGRGSNGQGSGGQGSNG